MIARLWSARTTPALSSAYLEHFSLRVQPELQKLRGFLGFSVYTRALQEGTFVILSEAKNLSAAHCIEVLVTTYWDSFAAIDDFAGPDRESAVVADEAAALLTDFDRRVRHYELAAAAFPEPKHR